MGEEAFKPMWHMMILALSTVGLILLIRKILRDFSLL